MTYDALEKITCINDIRDKTFGELKKVASDLRELIIDVVSINGGHLAPNLGVIELTLALLKVFDPLNDKIVFDVGHQCYPFKILTDRKCTFDSIRQHDGISGFPKRDESDYDCFGTGHASTSISAALGFSAARDIKKQKHNVVAVIGDGALTGGMAYEALNNAGSLNSEILVVLNDNKMSISPNVGALSTYLTNIIATPTYNKLKNEIWNISGKILLGEQFRNFAAKMEDNVKNIFTPGMFFEQLGFEYFGPIDGHDIYEITTILREIKDIRKPKLLHVITEKGRGYAPAEKDRPKFHGIGSFDRDTGIKNSGSGRKSYTQVFGESMVELGDKIPDLTAITAAMALGTGLTDFSKKYPKRFFDVGIAEGHAVTFSAALALEGVPVVCTIYSTFLQRGYDQVIHDVALQKAPVVFALDRAGLVGADGPTHHGAFDISYLRTVPDLVVTVPSDEKELKSLLYTGIKYQDGPFSIRYPRGEGLGIDDLGDWEEIPIGSWEIKNNGDKEILIIATGTMVDQAIKAVDILKANGINPTVINARFIKPMDIEMLRKYVSKAKHIITIEENSVNGGFGEGIAHWMKENNIEKPHKIMGIPDEFISHGNTKLLLDSIGLSAKAISDYIRNLDYI